MTNTQEWQQENSIRAYPFSESILNFDEDSGLPRDFIVDLRFFPDRYTQSNVYLFKVEYNENTNQYTLEFRYYGDVEQTAIIGTVYRSGENNESIVGKPLAISGAPNNPYSVCVFTPGKLWDPILTEGNQTEYFWIKEVGQLEGGIYTKIFFDPQASSLDDSVINPGPRTIRRVFIDQSGQPLPPVSEWGKEVEQKLVAGYNFEFTQNTETGAIILNARGGKGEGYPDRDTDLVLLRINNTIADDENNVKIQPKGCLSKIERPSLGVQVGLEGEQTENIENTLQLFSDCLPCCGCDAYRAVSEAISRRSRLLKGVCDELLSMVAANAQLYNSAVIKINENRDPIVQIRNFRVYPKYFKISVQNVCPVPVYAHIGLNIVAGTVSSQEFRIPNSSGYSEINLIANSFSQLPPLATTNKDYLNLNPEIPSGQYVYFVLGSESTTDIRQPIPAGKYTDLTFEYTGSLADLRDSGVTISTQSNGIYGGQLNDLDPPTWVGTYGCKLDVYSARVEKDIPIVSENCGVVTVTQGYKIVSLET